MAEATLIQETSREDMLAVLERQRANYLAEGVVSAAKRKDRPKTGREPQYVWTNVELEWEEHHYIEVRYWASSSKLVVTVNGDPLLETTLAMPATDQQ